MSQHALTSPSLTLCPKRRIITTPIALTRLASESDSVEVSVFYVRVMEVLVDNVGDHTNVLCAIDVYQEKISTFLEVQAVAAHLRLRTRFPEDAERALQFADCAANMLELSLKHQPQLLG